MAVTLESLRKSVGKKNSKSKIFAWLADMELAAGDLDIALQRVNGGLTLYPNDISAKLVRAKILFQKGEFEECVQECESTLVKDPFNLAAQKIMGDAYDQLGNVAERNLCYRRYHDMDPLNSFWKDEYDVIPEAPAAAAAGAAMLDGDFSLPTEGDDSLNLDVSESDLFNTAEPVEENRNVNPFAAGNEAEEDSFGGGLFEKSSESSIEKAFGDTFGAEADDALDSEAQGGAKSSPFSSSFLDETPDDSAEKQTAAAGQEFSMDSFDGKSSENLFGGLGSLDESPVAAEESASDDPFAALAAMLPNSDTSDDATIDELSASLDSVMDSIKADETEKPLEEFPADENVSGNDVTAALSDMFGLDDDLEADETATPAASGFAAAEVDEKAEENASKIFETQSADPDRPLSVDDAFESIFGEDELPEEKPVSTAPVEEKPVVEDKVAEEWSVAEEKPAVEEWTVSEEKPAAEEWTVSEEKPAVEDKVAEDKPLSVDDAFESIFGEDELPEELPASTPVEEKPAEETLVAEMPAEENAAAGDTFSLDDFKEDDLDLEIGETEKIDAVEQETPSFVAEVDVPSDPVIASPMDFMDDDEPAEVKTEESAPANDETGVVSAFDSIFGADDDLPEENVASEKSDSQFEKPADDFMMNSSSLAEQVGQAEAELEMPSLNEKPEAADLAQEMGGAFASMFGDDDELDLPDAGNGSSEASSNDPQATTAALEEAAPAASEETLSSDLDKSFGSLFGDDDLDLPTENGNSSEGLFEKSAEFSSSTPVESSPMESPVSGNPDLQSLETEVSGAFKGLFDMEDDSLTEESKPSNSGVDFLMSGDSDDEISAGLIKNPDAPLNRGSLNLDDSMGTRTLAEIYFDQGLYGDALKMYQELVQRDPENEELIARKDQIEQLYREKFGGNA